MTALETKLSRPQQIAFQAGQEAENEFAVPGDHLKHRFIKLTDFAFSAVLEEKNEFKLTC